MALVEGCFKNHLTTTSTVPTVQGSLMLFLENEKNYPYVATFCHDRMHAIVMADEVGKHKRAYSYQSVPASVQSASAEFQIQRHQK